MVNGRLRLAGRSEPSMSARGAVTLGELVGRLDQLEACCRRCERRGPLRLARLIAEPDAGTGPPDWAARLATDCRRVGAPDPAERCFVSSPQLLEPSYPSSARHSIRRRPPPAFVWPPGSSRGPA